MFLPHNKNHLKNARRLRRDMTKEERHLWYDFLRYYPIKVLKQKPIGNYIVDFFCEKAHLIIEIDGTQHFEDKGLKSDSIRTEYLESFGLKVVRFSNYEINNEFDSVCEALDKIIKGNTKD